MRFDFFVGLKGKFNGRQTDEKNRPEPYRLRLSLERDYYRYDVV
jgi:hypothetical protein